MFLKLTSAYGGILLVNMDLIVSVQSRRKTTYKDTAEVIDGIKASEAIEENLSILTRNSGGQFEVTESFEEICRMMEAK